MSTDWINIPTQRDGGHVLPEPVIELQDAVGTLQDTSVAITGTQTVAGVKTFSSAPVLSAGFTSTAQSVAPAADSGAGSTVLAGVTSVAVAANTTDVNDWIVLPALASVPVGHTITVVSNAAGHEVRTPATSNEKINNQDSDGTKEYAIAAGSQVHLFTKISDSIGWMGHGFTAIGAVVTAVVPD